MRSRRLQQLPRALRCEPGELFKPGRLRLGGSLGGVAHDKARPLLDAVSKHHKHRRGEPIVDFRDAWSEACEAAKVPGLLFHDLERSAVRNMEKSGEVTQAVAMRITGHKTDSVYRRYRIVDEQDIERALAKTQESIKQAPASNVASIEQGRRKSS